MNFNQLYRQIRALDEGQDCNECGMMGPANIAQERSQQPDSVSMNVSMNASGAGGIKSLLDILKQIEQGTDSDSYTGTKLFGRGDGDARTVVIGDDYANSSQHQQQFDVAAVTNPPSDDLHAATKIKPRPASISGNNPMAESLRNRLSNLYFEVRSR